MTNFACPCSKPTSHIRRFLPKPKLLAVLLVSTLLFGCGKGSNDETPVATDSGQTSKEVPAALLDMSKRPDFTLDAQDWSNEWRQNVIDARQKYQGKVIELSGVVHRLSEDPEGKNGYLSLKTDDRFIQVSCVMTERDPWLKVCPGSSVKVRGIPSEAQGDRGVLSPCVLRDVGTVRNLDVSALILAKAFAADAQGAGAAALYADRWLIVAGEVESVARQDQRDFYTLALKGAGGIGIKTTLRGDSDRLRQRNEALKMGQQVRIHGQPIYSPLSKEIDLRDSNISVGW